MFYFKRRDFLTFASVYLDYFIRTVPLISYYNNSGG